LPLSEATGNIDDRNSYISAFRLTNEINNHKEALMNSMKKSRLLELVGVAAVVALFATVTLSAGRTALACDKNKSNVKAAAAQEAHTGQAVMKTAEAAGVLTCPVTGATVKVAAGCNAQQATAKTAEAQGSQAQFRTAEAVSGHACSASQAAAKTAAAQQACTKSAGMTTAAMEQACTKEASVKTAALEQACPEAQTSVKTAAAVTEGKTCDAKNASKMADAENTTNGEKDNTAQVIR